MWTFKCFRHPVSTSLPGSRWSGTFKVQSRIWATYRVVLTLDEPLRISPAFDSQSFVLGTLSTWWMWAAGKVYLLIRLKFGLHLDAFVYVRVPYPPVLLSPSFRLIAYFAQMFRFASNQLPYCCFCVQFVLFGVIQYTSNSLYVIRKHGNFQLVVTRLGSDKRSFLNCCLIQISLKTNSMVTRSLKTSTSGPLTLNCQK